MLRVEQDALARRGRNLRDHPAPGGLPPGRSACFPGDDRPDSPLPSKRWAPNSSSTRSCSPCPRPWVPRSAPKPEKGLDGHHPTRVLRTAGPTHQHLFRPALHQRHQRAGQSVARRHNPAWRYASPLAHHGPHDPGPSCWPARPPQAGRLASKASWPRFCPAWRVGSPWLPPAPTIAATVRRRRGSVTQTGAASALFPRR